ncbi:MAG: NAD(P)-dependent alcohol dehydrogenase [Chromatiales bacterium]|nr:NAD(P)-dependent alcohol dehydrogenase [Chromatiales bacterium]
MKAIVTTKYGPPEVLQLKEIKKPIPGKNEVCIKIHATAVTASDCIIRAFDVPAKLWLPMGLVIGFRKPRQPVLGMILTGEIESVGKGVKLFQNGDQIFGLNRFKFGAYAEYTCWPENSPIVLKPSNITYKEAAAIPFGGMLALHFVKRANILKGQNILIYGASGAVGSSAIQLAKYFGANVTGVCSNENMELVKSLGANTVIDYTKEDFTKKGKHYDFIFNAVGKRKVQLQCKNSLTANGKHITVDDGTPKMLATDMTFIKELVEAGNLKPVIDRTYPLEQMVEAHRYVDKGHKKGNVVISVGH